jgi:Uma2 family endonuclease
LRALVPDVAFLSYERLAYEDEEAAQIPYMAPDVAVEVLSPHDRRADVDDKIRVYLASGAHLVLMIDPIAQTFTADDSGAHVSIHVMRPLSMTLCRVLPLR